MDKQATDEEKIDALTSAAVIVLRTFEPEDCHDCTEDEECASCAALNDLRAALELAQGEPK